MSGAFLKCLSCYPLQSFCDCPSEPVEDLHQKVLSLLSGLLISDFAGNEPCKAQNLAKAKKKYLLSVG